MNTITRNTILLIIAAWLLLTLANCGKKSDPTPAETGAQKAAKILVGSAWVMQSVMVDATDKTSVYAGLTLTFTTSSFTTTKGGGVWSASGTWQFTDDTGTAIKRNDGLLITVSELTSTKLVLGLTWATTTLGGGRTDGVAGQHVFTFGK